MIGLSEIRRTRWLEEERCHPSWTGLSTNATCQLEKQENSQWKTRGPRLNLVVESPLPLALFSNQRDDTARKNLRNMASTRELSAERYRQQKVASKLGRECTGSPARIRTTVHGLGRRDTTSIPGAGLNISSLPQSFVFRRDLHLRSTLQCGWPGSQEQNRVGRILRECSPYLVIVPGTSPFSEIGRPAPTSADGCTISLDIYCV